MRTPRMVFAAGLVAVATTAIQAGPPPTTAALALESGPNVPTSVILPAAATEPAPVLLPTPAASTRSSPYHMTSSQPAPGVNGPLTSPLGEYNPASQYLPDCPLCDLAPCRQPCGPDGRFWISAAVIGWAGKGDRLPPLITTSPPGTPRSGAGVLGPGTSILFGDEAVNNGFRPGFLLNGGFWFDEDRRIGMVASFFYLGDEATTGNAFSPGDTILSRPFFNVGGFNADGSFNPGGFPDAELVSFPGVLAGGVNVNATSSAIGAAPAVSWALCCGCNYRLDVLTGFTYMRLREGVTISESLVATDTSPTAQVPAGTTLLVVDDFQTENNFYGGSIGLGGEYQFGRFFVGGAGAVAFGVTFKESNIIGVTRTQVPGGPVVTNRGGLLAQESNIGRYTSNDFAVVPQIMLRTGVNLTQNIRAFASYNFIYWSNVARPGDQIDLGVNTTQIPPGTLVGSPRPAPGLQSSDYWLQGIGGGLEFRY